MSVIVQRPSSPRFRWPPVLMAAAVAVGGALSMTIVLAAVAVLAAAMRGLARQRVPLLLTEDAAFPLFCAAAGVFTALWAGYITARANGGAPMRHGLASGMLAVAGHAAVVGVLGSPLSPLATAVYVGVTLPAVCAGCYLGLPAQCFSLPPTRWNCYDD